MKLLITIFCPSVSKSYDFWISPKIKVEKAVEVLCDEISEYEGNSDLFESENILLYSYLERKALTPSYTLGQLNIKSGDKLALI